MSFETFDERQLPLVKAALRFAKEKYGRSGLKLESPIDSSIRWRPTFHLKAGSVLIAAFEYNDALYSDALDGAIVDIASFDHPICVYQVCPLATFLGDRHQSGTRLLASKGIGIVTIDEETKAVAVQKVAVPLAQHISEEHFARAIRPLRSAVRLSFKQAYDTYNTDVGQGLQASGQIVESLIRQLHDHAVKSGDVTSVDPVTAAATLTDRLFTVNKFAKYRGVLGGTRQFLGNFRNIASHPGRRARDVFEKIRRCRAGVLEAVELADGLASMARQEGCRLTIHLT